MREGQILYTYLHLAADADQALLERKIVGIAYETIQLADQSLPLLAPMVRWRTDGDSDWRNLFAARSRR